MLTVEDLLITLCQRSIYLVDKGMDAWAFKFVGSVSEHVLKGRALTTEQAKVILRLGSSCKDHLVQAGVVEEWAIDRLLRHPRYRQDLVQSTTYPREVRHLGSNLLGFRFKLNENIRNDIRTLSLRADGNSDDCSYPWFDQDHRLWIVPVTRNNISRIMALIKRYGFDFDEQTLEYITLCNNSPGNPSSAFVMGDRIYLNVCDDEPLKMMVQNMTEARHE